MNKMLAHKILTTFVYVFKKKYTIFLHFFTIQRSEDTKTFSDTIISHSSGCYRKQSELASQGRIRTRGVRFVFSHTEQMSMQTCNNHNDGIHQTLFVQNESEVLSFITLPEKCPKGRLKGLHNEPVLKTLLSSCFTSPETLVWNFNE